uniref:Transposable element P transposase n=2 Tax=Melanaphis sacchari TaxID=742174 RepID=A0A2H8TZB4_9HEMI
MDELIRANILTNYSQCSIPDTFIRRPNASETAVSAESTQTGRSGAQIPNSLFVRTPKKHSQQESSTAEHFVQLCEQYLTPSLLMFVKNNLLNNNKANIKQYLKDKYSKKQLALILYFIDPVILNLIKKSFKLPSLKTLKKIIHQYDMKPGLNDFVFNFIKLKISNFKLNALDCVLYVDQMSIQSHFFYNISKDRIIGFNQLGSHKTFDKARQALVFMIRGINFKWKQKIAYYLLSSCTVNNLISIVFSIIRQLKNINLNVRVFISNQSKEFINFSKVMNVFSNEPYFDVDDQRITYIFNPSTLLRTTCDMFFKYSLHVDDEVVEKKYLDMYFNCSISNCDLDLKFTYKHIHSKSFDEIKVNPATQIFSASVAARMCLAMNSGILPTSALPTINFINSMHELFNIFNNPYKNITPQKDHLTKMTEFFKKIKVINDFDNSDITRDVNFTNGWLVSISGLIMLWETLKPITNKEYTLRTHWLNIDFLDNWFDKVKKHNGNEFKPTSIQFVRTFKNLFYQDYFQYFPRTTCSKDFDQIICEMNDQPLSNNIFNVTHPQKQNLFKFSPFIIGTVDYRHLKIPERNSLPYICGYLMNKCLEKHICEICINYAYCQKSLDQSFLVQFYKFHSYSVNSTCSELLSYQDNFQDYIVKLDYIFELSFPVVSIEDNVGTQMKDCLSNVRLNHPCNLFDRTFLLNLYIRFKIFATIKFLNNSKMSEEHKLVDSQIIS